MQRNLFKSKTVLFFLLVFILRGLSASARVLCPAWTSHKLGPARQLGSRPAAPVDGDDLLHQELPVSVLAVRQHRLHDPRTHSLTQRLSLAVLLSIGKFPNLFKLCKIRPEMQRFFSILYPSLKLLYKYSIPGPAVLCLFNDWGQTIFRTLCYTPVLARTELEPTENRDFV